MAGNKIVNRFYIPFCFFFISFSWWKLYCLRFFFVSDLSNVSSLVQFWSFCFSRKKLQQNKIFLQKKKNKKYANFLIFILWSNNFWPKLVGSLLCWVLFFLAADAGVLFIWPWKKWLEKNAPVKILTVQIHIYANGKKTVWSEFMLFL